MRKPVFCICENKAQISCAITAQLISAFVFATCIVQSLYFLSLKFQVSRYLLWLDSLVVSDLVGYLEDRFSDDKAHIIEVVKNKGMDQPA